MKTVVIIDRFENGFAVCEDSTDAVTHISVSMIPSDAREGDRLMLENGVFVVDASYAPARRDAIKRRMDALISRGRQTQ